MIKMNRAKLYEIILSETVKYLEERITDIVYHMTPLKGMESIVKTNKFLTSVAKGVESDEKINKGKMYYFSTARSITNTYMKDEFEGNALAILVLDGEKLSQRYKGTAVNYWGKDSWSAHHDETEDRVFTDDPFINNAFSYIKEVHLGVDLTYNHVRLFKGQERQLMVISGILKKNGIPLFVYADKKDFRLLNKKNALPGVVSLIKKMRATEKIQPDLDMNTGTYQEEVKDFKDLVKILHAVEREDLTGLDTDENRWYRNILWHESSVGEQTKYLIQGQRKNPEMRKYIEDIFYLMRAKKMASFDELVKYLHKNLLRLRLRASLKI